MHRGLLSILLFFRACLPESRQPVPVPIPLPAVVAPHPANPAGDGSYEAFLDAVLDRREVLFADTAVSAGPVSGWSEDAGFYISEPQVLFIDGLEVAASKLDVVHGPDRYMRYDAVYSEDTTWLFRFRGRRYAWMKASYRMCNGSGCLQAFYFLADFSRRTIHAFETFAAPQYDVLLGDMNGDGRLDFLIPGHTNWQTDSTQDLSLYAYTLDDRGRVRPLRNRRGRRGEVRARFDGGLYAPRRFQVLDSDFLARETP